MTYKTDTLCWGCGNAVPNEIDGCEWSRDGEDVPGWKVEKYLRSGNGSPLYEAIHVVSCPKYKPSCEHHRVPLQDIAVERLAHDIVRRAVNDYTAACKQEAKGKRLRHHALEKEFTSPGNWALDYLDMDGKRIVKAIRARFGLEE